MVGATMAHQRPKPAYQYLTFDAMYKAIDYLDSLSSKEGIVGPYEMLPNYPGFYMVEVPYWRVELYVVSTVS